MRDTEFYDQLLGLSPPWFVSSVDLSLSEERVYVHVANLEKILPCPICGAASRRHDGRHREWRHLDTCQMQTFLIAEVPRVKCLEHGVKQVPVPWAYPGSGFTAQFEGLVILWLKEASMSAVGSMFDLGWSAVDGIMKRAVDRGLKRRVSKLPEHLGIDEKSFKRRHNYVTVICDQKSGHVVHVVPERKRSGVEEYLQQFDEVERRRVKTVAMDMWPAFIKAVENLIPKDEEKICFDKFHLAQHLSKAVDQVRRQEHRKFLKQGGASPLKGTKYLWLKNVENMTSEWRDALESLKPVAQKTARAWAIRQAGMDTWRYRPRHWARSAMLRWYSWAIRSRLEPIKKVARTVKRHLEGFVNAIHHQVTNARSEGINSRIQWIKYTARGFRNMQRFINAIYFHLGGLDMEPDPLKENNFHSIS